MHDKPAIMARAQQQTELLCERRKTRVAKERMKAAIKGSENQTESES